MSQRWLFSTPSLIAYLSQDPTVLQALGSRAMGQVACSTVSLEMILADADLLAPDRMRAWRAQVTKFRSDAKQAGAVELGLDADDIRKWGDIRNSSWKDTAGDPIPPEERFVIATALHRGLIYITPPGPWLTDLQTSHSGLVDIV